MKYLAVLGRQPLLSIAELESLFFDVRRAAPELAEFAADDENADAAEIFENVFEHGAAMIRRLGGTQKIAVKIETPIVEFLKKLPENGKITLGCSDHSRGATAFKAQGEALKLKRILTKLKRSVRVVPNKDAVLSSATSFHNGLFRENKIEILKNGKDYYRVIAVQDIDAYVKRDQARPARDAKVGMLPPKLAQIIVNLCGNLPAGSRLLDPFCGTGVVLQEAALMGYMPYGTDISERMVEYTRRNLEWLYTECGNPSFWEARPKRLPSQGFGALPPRKSGSSQKEDCRIQHTTIQVSQGDATNYQWEGEIDAVACECFLGQPMSNPPAEIKLKQEKQECKTIILGFLKNLSGQIKSGTPVVVAMPAWLRPSGEYERLNLLDEIENLSYNVKSFKNLGQEDLLYHRDGQIVAREIIVLRKK